MPNPADPNDQGKNIYRIDYEIDLERVDQQELQTIANELVQRLMNAAAAGRGGSVGHERSCHDKVHGKWG